MSTTIKYAEDDCEQVGHEFDEVDGVSANRCVNCGEARR